MAIMIPPEIIADRYLKGEQLMFDTLTKLPDTYYVFHSLGLKECKSKKMGEIDFVVLCSQGILCIEVKGGKIRRENGIWDIGGRKTTKDPFQQAEDCAQDLRRLLFKRLVETIPDIGKICFGSAVAFPAAKKEAIDKLEGPEINHKVLWYKDKCHIETFIQGVFDHWKSKHSFYTNTVTQDTIESIRGYLRGDFGITVALSHEISETEEMLKTLTSEQVKALDIFEENERVLLKGGAGTGKTLLCMEQAFRRALSGENVLFLCFNRNLAIKLRSDMRNTSPNIRNRIHIKIFLEEYMHGYLESIGKLPQPPTRRDDNDYWVNRLPSAFYSAATREPLLKYDYLIIDESQDILYKDYIMCLDISLKNGLRNGQWLFSYDPNQSIFSRNYSSEGLDNIKGISFMTAKLSRNCRTTKKIIEYADSITGISAVANLVGDGLDVTEDFYNSYEDLISKVVKYLEFLAAEGVDLGEVCLLSNRLHKDIQAMTLLKERLSDSLQDIADVSPEKWNKRKVKFSSVSRFKGLEASVVIILDIEEVDGEIAKKVNYTSITRPRSMLHVFYHEKLKRISSLF